MTFDALTEFFSKEFISDLFQILCLVVLHVCLLFEDVPYICVCVCVFYLSFISFSSIQLINWN